MLNMLMRFFKNEEGQAMTEYGLIIALVAVLVMGSLLALSGKLNTLFNGLTF